MNVMVGERIRKLRKEHGLSQEEIADKLNISQSSYARIEKGESNSWVNHISKLTELFNVKPEDFVSEDSYYFNNQDQKGGIFQNVVTIENLYNTSENLLEEIKNLKQEIEALKKKF